MRRAIIITAFGGIAALTSAQSGSGLVSQRIEELRSGGASFQRTTLFTKAPRSSVVDALWDRAIARAEVLQLLPGEVGGLLNDRPEQIALELPFGTGTITLDLERASITTDDFTVVQASTGTPVDLPAGVHYRGMLRGARGSVVAISVFQGEVMGLISSDDGDLVLGPMEGDQEHHHLLYRSEDLLDRSGPSCGTMDNGIPYTKDQLRPGAPKTLKCVRFYWEVNYDIYQGKGSVVNATNYVTGLFNQSATLYNNDGITVSLQQVFVWDVPSPYTATSTGDLLDQFGDYRTSFNGDLAHLLGYVGGGGIAWLDGLCDSQARYKMAYSDINSTYQNVPTYSWSVEVVTHEQGHLMGSKHTHACAWNGNNTAIDGCGPAVGYSEGSCAAGPVPSSSVGGTIMSYCHLVSAGINFNNGFGPQPKTLIVNNVNGSSCLGTCSSPPPTCGVPSGLSAGSITSSSALLSWTAVSGATSYTLQWKATSASVFTTVSGISTTSYSLSGLAPSTAYHFQALAVCAGGSSAYSSLASFTTTAGTCTDNYEPNNTGTTATVISANSTINAKVGSSTDHDWFRFSNTSAQRNIKVTLTNLPANYTLRLYRNGVLVATSANAGTASEQIIYNTTTAATTYQARVNGVNGAYSTTQCYTLSVQISATPFSTMGMEGGGEEAIVGLDVNIYPNPASSTVNIELPPSPEGVLVEVLDGTGRLIRSSASDGAEVATSVVFDLGDRPEGIYLVRVTRAGESTVERLVIAR